MMKSSEEVSVIYTSRGVCLRKRRLSAPKYQRQSDVVSASATLRNRQHRLPVQFSCGGREDLRTPRASAPETMWVVSTLLKHVGIYQIFGDSFRKFCREARKSLIGAGEEDRHCCD